MLLIKQVGVYLNLIHNKFKHCLHKSLKDQGVDLSPEQFLLMDILWNKGPMPQQVIADILLKDKNSITKLIDTLEKKGQVERIPDKIDRRQKIIAPTQIALERRDAVKLIATESVLDILKNIPEDELHVFLKVTRQIEENINKILDKEEKI